MINWLLDCYLAESCLIKLPVCLPLQIVQNTLARLRQVKVKQNVHAV